MIKKVYISGAITGLDYNQAFKAFQSKEIELNSIEGIQAVNPMKIKPETPWGRESTWEEYMVADIAKLFECSTIVMLKGWENSKGARIEHDIAIQMGMDIIYESDAPLTIYKRQSAIEKAFSKAKLNIYKFIDNKCENMTLIAELRIRNMTSKSTLDYLKQKSDLSEKYWLEAIEKSNGLIRLSLQARLNLNHKVKIINEINELCQQSTI